MCPALLQAACVFATRDARSDPCPDRGTFGRSSDRASGRLLFPPRLRCPLLLRPALLGVRRPAGGPAWAGGYRAVLAVG